MWQLILDNSPLILSIFVGGAVVGALWHRHASKKVVNATVQSAINDKAVELTSLKTTIANQDASAAQLNARLVAANDESQVLRQKYVEVHGQVSRLGEKVARIPTLENEIAASKEKLAEAQTARSLAQQRIKVLETELDNEKSTAQEKLELLERVEEKFNKQFKITATQVLDENGQKFSQQNRESLSNLITPLKEQLDKFDQRIGESRTQDAKERQQVRSELKQIAELGLSLSERAENLTNALKGDVKAQGTWGEMILETVLEKSGLEKGREYIIQETHTNDDGRRIRPDVVVTLPENKVMVVDSKVSLTAYEQAINAENDELRTSAVSQHVQSVKNHVLGLSTKNYQDLIGASSLDFTLMFVPNESALTLALNHSPELFDLAMKHNIGLVSPNLLMISLRTVENIWRTEKQNQNAQEIARQAGLLYDKVVGFVDELNNIGSRIDQARGAYDKALSRLKTGSGNIIGRVEKLRRLGARTNKTLPVALLRANDSNDDNLTDHLSDAESTPQ